MENIAFKLEVNLSQLLIRNSFTLHAFAEEEVSNTIDGFQSVIKKFIESYNFLPLTEMCFTRVSSDGTETYTEPLPDYLIVKEDMKGRIVEIVNHNRVVTKFFVVDSSTSEHKEVINKLISNMVEMDLPLMANTINLKDRCLLSHTIGYLKLESKLLTKEELESTLELVEELIEIKVIDKFVSTPKTAVNTVSEITANPNEPLEILGKLVGKVTSKIVFPMGEIKVDYNSKWVRNLTNVLNDSDNHSFRIPMSYNSGFLINTVDTSSDKSQTYFVKQSTKEEAHRILNFYLKQHIENFNSDSIEFDYEVVSNTKDVVTFLIREILDGHSKIKTKE